MSGAAIATGGGQDPESEFGHDQVKVFSHEGDDVENTEHLNSMDLHDVKSELEKDAEKAETRVIGSAVATISQQTSNVSTVTNVRPFIPQMVYTNGVPFMMPQFPAGTPIYHVPAPGPLRSIKVEGPPMANWTKAAPGIYGYPAGFFPVDQSTLRPAYPFMIPGQYVTASMPYQQQIGGLGTPVAPNAAVQPNSGIIAPQVKEKRPHIKKPLNAFMLFMKEMRSEVIKECTLKESAAINQILGKRWHALDRSEQAKYYEMAREERARHMQMYPGWSARDNYAVHKKRKKRKVKQVQQEEQEDQEEQDQDQSADDDPNARKCRARYGMEQQNLWCGPCRRKKKCIKYSEEDDGHSDEAHNLSAEKGKDKEGEVFSPEPPSKQQKQEDVSLCKDTVTPTVAT